MSAYYNEFDPFAAEWLRNLINAGLIAPGDVDERDIRDVSADDLVGYDQCHFFAGIGGWSLALRLAGWPDDRPVWTGSPPCQPFSVAGKGLGKRDERHLAPVWIDLVKECRPPVIFGEQVAAAASKDEWLDDLQDELEAQGYATGAVVLPACGLGAPHIRQRLWFVAKRVADTSGARSQGRPGELECADQLAAWPGGVAGGMANMHSERCNRKRILLQQRGQNQARTETAGCREPVRMEHASSQRRERRKEATSGNIDDRAASKRSQGEHGTCKPGSHRVCEHNPGSHDSFWQAADWLFCKDGKWRPVEPGTFPLAYGIPARVGRLRAYGNAIVPQVAAEVIKVVMEYAP